MIIIMLLKNLNHLHDVYYIFKYTLFIHENMCTIAQPLQAFTLFVHTVSRSKAPYTLSQRLAHSLCYKIMA